MTETELLDKLEQAVKRVGLRPVLEILVDWIGRGLFLEVFAQVEDSYPWSTPDERRATP